MKIYVIIITLITFTILLLYFLTNKKHSLLKDPFFDRMTSLDLVARSSSSIESYKHLYISSLINFTDLESNLLSSLTSEIDKYISSNSLIYNIPWKFAKLSTSSHNIENGFPHTLLDTIILPDTYLSSKRDKISMMKTLLHEKIHIFQRMYPRKTDSLIQDIWKFIPTVLPHHLRTIARNNPDIPIPIYYIKNGYIPVQIYTSSHPRSILDSSTIFYDTHSKRNISLKNNPLSIPEVINQQEHPYEMMAVVLPLIIIDKIKSDNFYIDGARLWLSNLS